MTRARRERLILENMPMVRRVAIVCARKFSPRLPLEDYLQDGYVGLCEAARRCSRVSTFPQFAYFRVRGAIVDARRRHAYQEELLNLPLDEVDVIAFLERPDLQMLPDELAVRAELGGFLDRAIAELPDDERYVMRESLQGVQVEQMAIDSRNSETWAWDKLTSARRKVIAAVSERAS